MADEPREISPWSSFNNPIMDMGVTKDLTPRMQPVKPDAEETPEGVVASVPEELLGNDDDDSLDAPIV